MRQIFIFMRAAGYTAAAIGPFWQARPVWQWLLSLFIILAGTIDLWKKADDPSQVLLRGIGAEYLFIVFWSIILQDSSVLFILVSPLSRCCVHLGRRSSGLFALTCACTLLLFHVLYPSLYWILPAQLGFLLLQGSYSFVLGQLLMQRDQLRRIVAMTAVEREQNSKDEERIRIAAQLHDSMGQYWTAVIRALDVALLVDGLTQRDFITKAQTAALDGLQEMRSAVHDWNEGRRSPAGWMDYLEQAVVRYEQMTGIQIKKSDFIIDWDRLDDPLFAAEAIVRLSIEAITNAIRHGQATGVWLHSQTDEREFRLLIRDNGNGFSPRAGEVQTGLGHASMQKMMHGLKGSWRVESAAGNGTTLFLSIPYKTQMQAVKSKEASG